MLVRQFHRMQWKWISDRLISDKLVTSVSAPEMAVGSEWSILSYCSKTFAHITATNDDLFKITH